MSGLPPGHPDYRPPHDNARVEAARKISLFGNWLEETRRLQVEAYGCDPWVFEYAEFGDFINVNVTAMVAELGEMLAEIPGWKTWVTERGRPGMMGRTRAVGEVVDLLHFIANVLIALRCTDLELRLAYAGKMERNRARMRAGDYDGRTGKCPSCGRALDDVGIKELNNADGVTLTYRCGACDGLLFGGTRDVRDESMEH